MKPAMAQEQTITKYVKLPFVFDETKLIQDLESTLNNNWISHFNTTGYDGEWKVIPLYAQQGNESNIFALPNENTLATETSVLKNCSYFKEVIDSFKFTILSARILRLGVGAKIKPHRDHELGYENGNFRLHIPITTNKEVSFILDNDRLTMLPGECWYTNVNYVHSVSNSGNSARVHLVIDGKRNTWTDNLFFSLAPKESFLSIPKETVSIDTIKKTIEELKRNQLPASKQLIHELEQKLIDQ